MLGVKPHQLEAKDHKIMVKGYPQRSVHIADVSNHARVVTGEPPIGSASFSMPRRLPKWKWTTKPAKWK
jgi:hypothetical protein